MAPFISLGAFPHLSKAILGYETLRLTEQLTPPRSATFSQGAFWRKQDSDADMAASQKLHEVATSNDNESLSVVVAPSRWADGEWVVEAVDDGSEGEVYTTIFIGPKAESRARNYALLTYGC